MVLNKVSIFENPTSRKSALTDLRTLHQFICQGRWRPLVERIRKAITAGDKKEANRLKMKLPYTCFGGIFDGGHAAAQLQVYSSIIVIDYDNQPVEQLETLKALAMQQPFTIMAYITPSGRGLKVVVQTNALQEHHALAYALVTDHYDRLLGLKSDAACKDISRGHLVSYDPLIMYQEPTHPFDVLSMLDDSQAENFVRSYLVLHPIFRGERNIKLFPLACEACKRGLDQQDIIHAATQAMADETFDVFEITRIVKSAYSRKEDKKRAGQPVGSDRKCPVSDQVPLGTKNNKLLTDEEDEKPDGEELRELTPQFPKSVYDQLPEFLHTALKFITEAREKDMLLLAIFTVLSGLFYSVSGFYNRRRHYPGIFCFVVAPPACGKGVMDYAMALCKYYLLGITEENDRISKEYKAACEEYEKQCRNKRPLNGQKALERPEPPTFCFPHIPATSSKSRFLLHLRDNKEKGGFIFDLEADTLTAAGKLDYGNYFDYLRKIFHHETISDSYKINEKPTYVDKPKLAMLLAGTPAQLCRLIPSPEDGLYSRKLFYTYRQLPVWKDISPGGDEAEVERHFDTLSMRLKQMIIFLGGSPTQIKLSQEQWNKLNDVFGTLLTQEKANDREDFQGCIKRHCLITFRICMILTALDKAAMRTATSEVYCSESHFEVALQIVTCCLEHSRLLITSLKSTDKDVNELQNPNKMSLIMDRLPEEFTSVEFLEVAAFFNLQRRTAFRILKRSIGLYVSKIRKGLYKKECLRH